MKNLILITCLSIFSFGSFASDLNAEKEALIEAIKANYDSWCLHENFEANTEEPAIKPNHQQVLASSNQEIKGPDQRIKHNFSDFTFRINNNQAVVQFQVDYQMISAFMEKKEGKWKLVCAALIPPDL